MSAFGRVGFGSANRQNQLSAQGHMEPYGNQVRQAMQAPKMTAYQAPAVNQQVSGQHKSATQQPVATTQPQQQSPQYARDPQRISSPGTAQSIQPQVQGTPYGSADDGFLQYASKLTGRSAEEVSGMMQQQGIPQRGGVDRDALALQREKERWDTWAPDQRQFAMSQPGLEAGGELARAERERAATQNQAFELEQRASRSADPAESDRLLYQASQLRGGQQESFEDFARRQKEGRQQTEQRRAQEADDAERWRQTLSQYQRPDGMSDEAFNYLVSQESGGQKVWEAPSFTVWSELLGRGGPEYARQSANNPGLQSSLRAEMDAYNRDVRYASNAATRDAPGWGQADPLKQLSWKPFSGRVQRTETAEALSSSRPETPGQAQPTQPTSQGTPYNPSIAAPTPGADQPSYRGAWAKSMANADKFTHSDVNRLAAPDWSKTDALYAPGGERTQINPYAAESYQRRKEAWDNYAQRADAESAMPADQRPKYDTLANMVGPDGRPIQQYFNDERQLAPAGISQDDWNWYLDYIDQSSSASPETPTSSHPQFAPEAGWWQNSRWGELDPWARAAQARLSTIQNAAHLRDPFEMDSTGTWFDDGNYASIQRAQNIARNFDPLTKGYVAKVGMPSYVDTQQRLAKYSHPTQEYGTKDRMLRERQLQEQHAQAVLETQRMLGR